MSSSTRKERKDRDLDLEPSSRSESRREKSSRRSRSKDRERSTKEVSSRTDYESRRKGRSRDRSHSRSDSRDRRRKRRRSEEKQQGKSQDRKSEDDTGKYSKKSKDDIEDRRDRDNRETKNDTRRDRDYERERGFIEYSSRRDRKRSLSRETTTTRLAEIKPSSSSTSFKELDQTVVAPSYLEQLESVWLEEKQKFELSSSVTDDGISINGEDNSSKFSVVEENKNITQERGKNISQSLLASLDIPIIVRHLGESWASRIAALRAPLHTSNDHDGELTMAKQDEIAVCGEVVAMEDDQQEVVLTMEQTTIESKEDFITSAVAAVTTKMTDEKTEEEEKADELYHDLNLSNTEEDSNADKGDDDDDLDLYGDLQLDMDTTEEEEGGMGSLLGGLLTEESAVMKADKKETVEVAKDIMSLTSQYVAEFSSLEDTTGSVPTSSSLNTSSTAMSGTVGGAQSVAWKQVQHTLQYPSMQPYLRWNPLPYHIQEPSYDKLVVMAELSQGIASASTIFNTMGQVLKLKNRKMTN